MSELIVVGDKCISCGQELPDSGNFCSNCGSPATAAGRQVPSTGVISQPQHLPAAHAPQVVIIPQTQLSVVDQALNNRAIVICILLFAGPIGLPALWFSGCFSKPTKIITTAAYFLLTAVLPLLAVWYFLEVSLRPLVNVFGG